MNIPVFLIFTARIYDPHIVVRSSSANLAAEPNRGAGKAGLSRKPTNLTAAPAPRGEQGTQTWRRPRARRARGPCGHPGGSSECDQPGFTVRETETGGRRDSSCPLWGGLSAADPRPARSSRRPAPALLRIEEVDRKSVV